MAQGMAHHQSGFDEFTGYVKRILMFAGFWDAIWPFQFSWLKDVQKRDTKGLTRSPFRPSDINEKPRIA